MREKAKAKHKLECRMNKDTQLFIMECGLVQVHPRCAKSYVKSGGKNVMNVVVLIVVKKTVRKITLVSRNAYLASKNVHLLPTEPH
jgi:hypothetical protein